MKELFTPKVLLGGLAFCVTYALLFSLAVKVEVYFIKLLGYLL